MPFINGDLTDFKKLSCYKQGAFVEYLSNILGFN